MAIADILRDEARVIDEAVEAYRADEDPETLHQMRVAVRRTRAALKIAGDALPGDAKADFTDDFRWFGHLTGAVRDLDVSLAGLPEDDGLQAYRADLARRRAEAVDELRAGLGSERLGALRHRWRTLLDQAAHDPEPTDELARRSTKTAWKRVRKAGKYTMGAAPAQALHTMRKRCKELRYVIELFGEAYEPNRRRSGEAYEPNRGRSGDSHPSKSRTRVVAGMKRLQDALGEFQDCQVHGDDAAEFATAHALDDAARHGVERYAAGLRHRQQKARKAYHREYETFAHSHMKKRIRALTAA